MTDPKIGRGNEWPLTTISGREYTRPVSTLDIGNGQFVVLDIFPPANETELLAPYIGKAVELKVPPELKAPAKEDKSL